MIGSLSCGEFYPNPYLTLAKARLLLHFVIRVKAVTVSNRQQRRPRQSHLTTPGMFDITSFFSCHSHQDEDIRKSVHISVSQVVQQWCITVNCAYTDCEQPESVISLCKVNPCLTHERER